MSFAANRYFTLHNLSLYSYVQAKFCAIYCDNVAIVKGNGTVPKADRNCSDEHTCSKWRSTLPGQLCDDESYTSFQPPQPVLSMTPSTRKQYDPLEELDALDTPKPSARSTATNKKASEKSADKKSSNSGGSWFGGLFSKLAPKPKNQMILPDDNNPTVGLSENIVRFFCRLLKKVTIDGFMFYVAKGSRGYLW